MVRSFAGPYGDVVVVVDDVVYSLKRHFDPKTRPQGAWLWSGRIVGLDDTPAVLEGEWSCFFGIIDEVRDDLIPPS